MTEILSASDLLPLRMRALGLERSTEPAARSDLDPAAGTRSRFGPAQIAAAARRMLATQGQDWRSARWALGVRAPGTTVADVHGAFAEGLIVRSWPMRGTLHVVAAEDIGWIQGVTGHRVLAGAPARRKTIGLTDQTLDRLVEVSLEALRGSTGLDRDALSAVWTAAGIEWQSGWRYHVIWWLCQNGLATFGPVHDTGEPLLVRTDEWISSPLSITGDEALATLATRYVGARGPVRDRDFSWWTGLTLREARRGLELARESGKLVTAHLDSADGPALWADPDLLGYAEPLGSAGTALTPHASAHDHEWLLLPSFDEHLLGYTDRAPQLPPEHFDRIVPGRNGMFLATVVEGGRVRGTWKRGARVRSGLEVTPFPGERVEAANLATPLAEWHSFHQTESLPVTVLPTPENLSPPAASHPSK